VIEYIIFGFIKYITFNYHNGDNNDEYEIVDKLLYKERFIIERTVNFMFSSWKAFNYITFDIDFIKEDQTN
jgi:hypothetical protein